MSDLHFSVTAAFDRKLIWEGGDSVRYLVARLKASRAQETGPDDRAPLNIALVIDASGSMSGGKLEAAKQAALGLAQRLTERDRLTLVSFASDVQVHLDAVPVTPGNARRIEDEIQSLQTRGMTCLSGGWFAGVDCAARIAEEDAGMTPRVILLSDGHANEGIVDPGELCEHAGELRLRGVLTSALGIGDGYDEQLLRGIAENGGGRLHDAELASEISLVLLGELEDIFGTLVENARVKLTPPPGVHIEVLGHSRPDLQGGSWLVPVGPVQNGIERHVVFKVTCPGVDRNRTFDFTGEASGHDAADDVAISAQAVTASLVAADDLTNSQQARDVEVAAIVAKTWKADVVAKAALMNRDHAFEEAERYVEKQLRYFRKYVQGLEGRREMLEELEMLSRRIGRTMSPRLHKEMVLESSLVLQSRRDRRGPGKASFGIRMKRGE